MVEIRSPLQGTVVRVVAAGTAVAAGGEVAVIESMKMEHTVDAPEGGTIDEVRFAAGDVVQAGDVLASLAPGEAAVPLAPEQHAAAGERSDLAEVRARHAIGLDAARLDAVERRRRTNQRTARRTSTTSWIPGRSSSTARS